MLLGYYSTVNTDYCPGSSLTYRTEEASKSVQELGRPQCDNSEYRK